MKTAKPILVIAICLIACHWASPQDLCRNGRWRHFFCVSSSQRYLASGGLDELFKGGFCILDTQTAKQVALETAGTDSLSISPDEKHFAVCGLLGHLCILELPSGKVAWDLSGKAHGKDSITKCLLTGKYLITTSVDESIRVWDVEKRELDFVILRSNAPEAERAKVQIAGTGFYGCYDLAFCKESGLLLIASGTNKVFIVDLHKRALEGFISTELKQCASLCISNCNKTVAIGGGGGGGGIEVWDIRRRVLVKRLVGHKSTVLCMKYSKDDTLILTGGVDDGWKLFEAASGLKHCGMLNEKQRISGVGFLEDRKCFVVVPHAPHMPIAVFDFNGNAIPFKQ